MNNSPELTILQVTDLHLFAEPGRVLLGVTTDASLKEVLSQAFSERAPDAVLITGDVAQDGEIEAYRRALDMVRERFTGPTLWLAGNHDLGSPMDEVHARSDLAGTEIILGDWHILTVDTHVDDQVEGHIDPDEMARLSAALTGSPASHVLVCGHHHPLPVGAPWLDTQIIDNADALLALLSSGERVRGYLFGHVHQPFDTSHGSLRVMGSPSTCFQFEVGSEQFAVDGLSPGYRWLTLQPDGGISTEIRRVEHITVQPIQRKRGY